MDLKRCPFCNGKAELVFSGAKRVGEWRGYIIVRCSRCGGASKGFFYHGPEIDIPLETTTGGEKAAESWNERHTAIPCDTCVLLRG